MKTALTWAALIGVWALAYLLDYPQWLSTLGLLVMGAAIVIAIESQREKHDEVLLEIVLLKEAIELKDSEIESLQTRVYELEKRTHT